MRTTLTLIPVLSMVSLPLAAQTLNNGNTSAVVGETFTMHEANYMPPGPAGASQTWNFASLNTGAAQALGYVTPASTGHSSGVPGANLAADVGSDNSAFDQTSANGWDLLGVYSSTGTVTMFYSNSERTLSYPLSYNDTWSDTFASNFTSNGFPVARAGSCNGIADGYGTLVMPYGTVTNVLRVKFDEDYSDDIGGFGTVDYDFTSYSWIKPGTHNPLLVINDNVTTSFGSPTTTQIARWLQGGPIGIDEALRNAIGIDIFPNPATDAVSVVFSSEGGSLQLEIIDNTGRLVRSEGLNATLGIGRHDLDVIALPAGLYMVRITAPNGQQGTQRLVVQ